MKKLFTLFFSILAGTTAMLAQSGVVFVDAAEGGNEVADGSTITVSNYENGQISSGLYVSNTTSEGKYVSVGFEIKEPFTGGHQICFPMNCTNQSASGPYETKQGAIKANETKDLQAEWIPTTYGTCTVTYTIKYYTLGGSFPNYTYNYEGDGATVTVKYVYNDPSGVNSATASSQIRSVEYYDLAGQKVSKPKKGVFLKRTVYATGKATTRKVVLK